MDTQSVLSASDNTDTIQFAKLTCKYSLMWEIKINFDTAIYISAFWYD